VYLTNVFHFKYSSLEQNITVLGYTIDYYSFNPNSSAEFRCFVMILKDLVKRLGK
jgi:hypothetical protein